MNEAQVIELLRERFKKPEFAFLPQVRNQTGYGRRVVRTADAIAMGLWPSRGLHLHGFEVKSERRDWVREKDDPEKAEEIAAFCHFWWLVVAKEEMVQAGELPPTWGLMAPRGKGLSVIKEPVFNKEAKPVSYPFLAAILRRAQECILDVEIQAGIEKSREEWEKSHAYEVDRLKKYQEEQNKMVETFEKASGVHVSQWDAGNVGEAVGFVMRGGLQQAVKDIQFLRKRAMKMVEELDAALAQVPQLTKTNEIGRLEGD